MKKVFRRLLPILVLLVFVFSSLDTFAADAPVLTKEEASSVMRLFWEIRESIGGCFMWFDSPDSANAGIQSFSGSEYLPQSDAGYWAKKVKTGYGPSEVKELIRDVFSKDYAEEILQDDADFFYGYFWKEDAEEWYYTFPWLDLWTVFDYKDHPTEFDFDSVSVVSCENGTAVIEITGVTNNHGERGIANLFSQQSFSTSFNFVWEDGKWKVSGGDYARMLYLVQNDDATNSDEFTKEIALTDINGAIFDVYYFSTVGYNYLITQGLATERTNKSEEWENYAPQIQLTHKTIPYHPYYEELEGNIGDPETWLTYARRFCTEELSLQIADFQNHVAPNGRLFYDGDKVEQPVYRWRPRREDHNFGPEYLSPDNVTVLTSDENQASVQLIFYSDAYSVWPYEEMQATEVPLRIDFIKEPDGWKISGGDFLEKLDALYAPDRTVLEEGNNLPEEQPDTGDNFLLPGLAAAALLALPLVRRKRKIAG